MRASVLVLAVRLERNFLPEGEVRGGLLGSLAERLSVHARYGACHALHYANENGGPIAGTAVWDEVMR